MDDKKDSKFLENQIDYLKSIRKRMEKDGNVTLSLAEDHYNVDMIMQSLYSFRLVIETKEKTKHNVNN